MLELNKIYNMKCEKGMSETPDKYFELAIVDPPYFSGPDKEKFYHGGNPKRRIKYKSLKKHWIFPNKKYFDELFRISKNQIIWGCNYYNYNFNTGRIVWDKKNDNNSFSDCEIAYCSLIKHSKFFRYLWDGFRQENMKKKEIKIHPTQKPVALYRWILQNYAKPNDKIIDTHMGSGSSVIACLEEGFEYIAFETDKDYFNAANKRIEEHKSMKKLPGMINDTTPISRNP